MNRLLVFIWLLATPFAAGAMKDSTKNFELVELTFGNSAIRPAQGSFIGSTLKPGAGYSGRLVFHVVSGLFIGGSFTHNRFWTNTDILYRQVYSRYSEPGFYTTPRVAANKRTDNVLALNVSYMFHGREWGIEPYAHAGVGIELTKSDSGEYTVHKKKMNDHYFSSTTASYMHRGTRECGAGLRFVIHLDKRNIGLFAISAGYSFGTMTFLLKENTIDYLDKTTHVQSLHKTPFTAWQVRAGFQIRFPP